MTAPPAASAAPARPLRSRSADGQVVGALLVVAGIGWLLDQANVVTLSLETWLSTMLIMLGLGLVLTSRRRRGGGGLIVLGLVMTIVLVGTSSVATGSDVFSEGLGAREVRPATLAAAMADDAHGVGAFDVDLTHVSDLVNGEETRLDYRLGVGRMTITVPEDVPVRIEGEIRGGYAELFGVEKSGSPVHLSYEDDDFDAAETRLVLDIDVGVGAVHVERGGPATG